MTSKNKLILFDYGIKTGLLLISFLILVTSTSTFLTYKVDANIKSTLSYFNKQGWAFFTKDPREKKLLVYKIKGNSLEELSNVSFSTTYAFGCNRFQRELGGEFYYIYNKLDTSSKIITNFQLINNFINSKDTFIVFKRDRFCNDIDKGKYLFCLKDNVPFAYYKYMKESEIKVAVTKVELE